MSKKKRGPKLLNGKRVNGPAGQGPYAPTPKNLARIARTGR